MTTLFPLSPTLARRLTLARQRLAGLAPAPDTEGIMSVLADIRCLQLDPTSAVARSHMLTLWSRVGQYDPAVLDDLLWKDRRLFEYWAHAASIVLTEDYELHHRRMLDFLTGDGAGAVKARAWIRTNAPLQRHILARLRRNGPLPARELASEGLAPVAWVSSGWTGGRTASRMLDFLWTKGRIMVAGRQGGQKLWDLAERCLPEWTPRQRLPWHTVVRRAAQLSLRALGVGTERHIRDHFTRGRYPGLHTVLQELEREGVVVPAEIREGGSAWPGPWYIHRDDVALAERLRAGDWQGRTTLLSPFDNVLCDRDRTELLFGFRFRIEIYVPQAKRQHGYYVLPILHGDRMIGRIDPKMDRKSGRLTIHAVHAEPGAPMTRATGRAIAGGIERLATFLGATDIEYGARIPAAWQPSLR